MYLVITWYNEIVILITLELFLTVKIIGTIHELLCHVTLYVNKRMGISQVLLLACVIYTIISYLYNKIVGVVRVCVGIGCMILKSKRLWKQKVIIRIIPLEI